MEVSSSADDYGINHPMTERTAICDYFLAGKCLSKSGFNATPNRTRPLRLPTRSARVLRSCLIRCAA
ncbi:hypothetical protein [Coprobacter fastidiosus]|uniref:hypothetical protein n=1 Tax=Coprobacter fastidiosus TaxID=1099853 RepID=UPI00266683B8|nr:hypothetical protein [Coprobacter fastidiosus]